MRWKTVRSAACSAMTGMDCTPDEPVPIRPTRSPLKSTPSCGQRAVWYDCPRKVSVPGISGSLLADRQPVAITKYLAVTALPPSVWIRQVFDGSS